MRRIVLIAGVVSMMAAAGHATTIVGMSERALARSADAIVIGTIADLETVGGPGGAIATLITVDVERVVKGRATTRVVLRQPGGAIEGRALWIAGSPEFRRGERQLLFLSAARDGTARTTALGLGQFTLAPHPRTAETMALRRPAARTLGARPVRRVRLARLLRTVERALAGQPATDGGALRVPDELAAGGVLRRRVDEFTLMDGPLGRWAEADRGAPVSFALGGEADRTLGPTATLAAIDDALAAWNGAGTTLHLVRGEPDVAVPLFCDGVSQIVFNDPFDEMPAPSACSGILALGGYCTFTEHDQVNGQRFFRISEGNITVNRGFGRCPFWTRANLSEVLTHEVGHTIGIAHSAEDDAAPPELRDATMFYQAHFDGRGAALRADDVAAARFVYGLAGGTDPGREDLDGDGVPDVGDNCPTIANGGQSDGDEDGAGDLCDPCPLASSAGSGTCEPILLSRLTGRTRRARTRLVWRGAVDVPAGAAVPVARARLTFGSGVVVDASVASGARGRSRLRYQGDGARVTLTPLRAGGYRARVVVHAAELHGVAPAFVSASLQVGERTFASTLACTASRRGFRCRP